MKNSLSLASSLPVDAADALLVARVWVEGSGPVLALVTPDDVLDLSGLAPTAWPKASVTACCTCQASSRSSGRQLSGRRGPGFPLLRLAVNSAAACVMCSGLRGMVAGKELRRGLRVSV